MFTIIDRRAIHVAQLECKHLAETTPEPLASVAVRASVALVELLRTVDAYLAVQS